MTVSRRTTIIATIVILFSACHAEPGGRAESDLITFEGTLLKFSPHAGAGCGYLYIHQVARYHVDRVLSGKYVGDEIVVDHPACDEDVFKNIPAGSRVRITVRVLQGYPDTATYPAIRSETPKIWYVAESSPPSAFVPPTKIDRH